MTEQEDKIQDEFDDDLRNLVDIYRTAKRLGIWAIGIFGFAVAALTVWGALKGFLNK